MATYNIQQIYSAEEFTNKEDKKVWLTIAPDSVSSSPNCRARLLTACVTLSTVILWLYVNQWFCTNTSEPHIDTVKKQNTMSHKKCHFISCFTLQKCHEFDSQPCTVGLVLGWVVPKSLTLDDFKQPKCTLLQKRLHVGKLHRYVTGYLGQLSLPSLSDS